MRIKSHFYIVLFLVSCIIAGIMVSANAQIQGETVEFSHHKVDDKQR